MLIPLTHLFLWEMLAKWIKVSWYRILFPVFSLSYTNIILFPDMRKALSRDVKKKSVIPLVHPVRPEEVD